MGDKGPATPGTANLSARYVAKTSGSDEGPADTAAVHIGEREKLAAQPARREEVANGHVTAADAALDERAEQAARREAGVAKLEGEANGRVTAADAALAERAEQAARREAGANAAEVNWLVSEENALRTEQLDARERDLQTRLAAVLVREATITTAQAALAFRHMELATALDTTRERTTMAKDAQAAADQRMIDANVLQEELRLQEAHLGCRSTYLDTKEGAVSRREEQAEKRMVFLEEWTTRVSNRENEVKVRERNIAAREDAVIPSEQLREQQAEAERRDAALLEKEDDLADRMIALQAREAQVREDERKVRDRETAVSYCEAAVTKRDAHVTKREAAVSNREAAVSNREAAVSERDAAVSKRDADVSERDADVTKRKAAVTKREDNVTKRETDAAKEDARLEQDARLKAREAKVNEDALKDLANQIGRREGSLEEKEKVLAQGKSILRERREGFDALEQAYTVREHNKKEKMRILNNLRRLREDQQRVANENNWQGYPHELPQTAERWISDEGAEDSLGDWVADAVLGHKTRRLVNAAVGRALSPPPLRMNHLG